jgi:hypothetical protein
MPLRHPLRHAVLVTLATAVAHAQASPNEITVDTTGATGFVSLGYGVHTANAALSSGFEVDGYTIAGTAGDRIRLALSTLTAGLDPVVTLRNGAGAVLSSASCSGTSQFGATVRCATALDVQLATTGLYTLNIADAGTDEAGSYILHLDQYPPVTNWQGFGYGAPTPYDLGHQNDSDYFAFFGASGSGARLSVGSLTAGLDPRVEVWDPSGQLVQSTACSGTSQFGASITCTVLIDLNFSADGIYKVGIDDAGWDETGAYQLGVTCLFGTCATSVPQVPEPPAFWLLGAGVAGLLSWRRRLTRYRD